MKTVVVQTNPAYAVCIERGQLQKAGKWLSDLMKPCVAALITDATVDALYGDTVAASLTDAGFQVERMAFAAGERQKNLQTYGEMLDFLSRRQLTRSDVVVALGGGVPGDVAGFAAATYLRGIRVVQIPTTLLAMVDSSVGGKTGVDLPAGKNLAGAFLQPIGVLCDPDVLQTLTPDVFTDGVAEMVKYGVLSDPVLFHTLATGVFDTELETLIARCVSIKAALCAEDTQDRGERQRLNLGHTLGHAIERLSDYAVPHGHAVATGMAYAAHIAAGLGYCDAACVQAIERSLVQNGLPIRAPFPAEALAQAALSDKKRAGGTLTFVLPCAIGQCKLVPFPVEKLPELTELALKPLSV